MLPLAALLVFLLWVYLSWFERASESLIRGWAGDNGLNLLLLERVRFRWRSPPGIYVGKNNILFSFVARSPERNELSGWMIVGASSMSLRPDTIRVVYNDS